MKLTKDFLEIKTTYNYNEIEKDNDNYITRGTDDWINEIVMGWLCDYFINETTEETTLRVDLPVNSIESRVATDSSYLYEEDWINYCVIPNRDGWESDEEFANVQKYKIVYEGNHLYRIVLRKPDEILTDCGWEYCPENKKTKSLRIATPYKMIAKTNGKAVTWQDKEFYDQCCLDTMTELFNKENGTNVKIFRSPTSADNVCDFRGETIEDIPFTYYSYDENGQNIEDVDFEEVSKGLIND